MDGPWAERVGGTAPLWLSCSRALVGRVGLRRWPSRPRCVLICDDRRLLIWPRARTSYSSTEVFLYLEETDGDMMKNIMKRNEVRLLQQQKSKSICFISYFLPTKMFTVVYVKTNLKVEFLLCVSIHTGCILEALKTH